MNLEKAKDELSVRIYDWSRRDLIRELEEGCPLLSQIRMHNRQVGAFIMWSESLSPADRIELAKALTMSHHSKAVDLKGEKMSKEDQRWKDAYYERVTYFLDKMPPLLTADETSSTFSIVNPDHCLDLIRKYSSALADSSSRGRSVVKCTRKFGDWRLITEFTFERGWRRLLSAFHISRSDEPKRPRRVPFPSLLFFWGISQTLVQVPSAADSEPMAKAMVKLAEHFVGQAEPLFAGLGIDD